MSDWTRRGAAFAVVLLVGLVATGQTTAHEQETYNVILVADGPMPANITDTDFVQGNAVVFRMKDTTENASIRISIDLDGDGNYSEDSDNRSTWLVESCELTDNGTMVDDSCAVSHTYEFEFNATPGVYPYMLERAINGSVVTSENYSMTLWKDVHDEPGVPTLGECFGIGCEEEVVNALDQGMSQEDILLGVMGFSAIGAVLLALSISRDRKRVVLEEE